MMFMRTDDPVEVAGIPRCAHYISAHRSGVLETRLPPSNEVGTMPFNEAGKGDGPLKCDLHGCPGSVPFVLYAKEVLEHNKLSKSLCPMSVQRSPRMLPMRLRPANPPASSRCSSALPCVECVMEECQL